MHTKWNRSHWLIKRVQKQRMCARTYMLCLLTSLSQEAFLPVKSNGNLGYGVKLQSCQYATMSLFRGRHEHRGWVKDTVHIVNLWPLEFELRPWEVLVGHVAYVRCMNGLTEWMVCLHDIFLISLHGLAWHMYASSYRTKIILLLLLFTFCNLQFFCIK